MKKISIDIPIIISRLKNHFEIKSILLNLIDEMPNNSMYPGENNLDKISKTDWNLPREHPRRYLDFIKPQIVETISESLGHYKLTGISFDNFWFQQYYQSDFHGWHVHINSHWTNVYFVELPDSRIKTEILKFGNEDLVDYDICEGDIISFPSMLYHRSPPNLVNARKTIISFNLNFISEFENFHA
jgi:hypothetical protein